MNLSLGEMNNKIIQSVRISDNLIFATPIIIVGISGVVEIKYHEPCGEGDKHFIDVLFENGKTIRCFDIVNIQFGKKEDSND